MSSLPLNCFQHIHVCCPTDGLIIPTEDIPTCDSKSMANYFASVFITVFTDTVSLNAAPRKNCDYKFNLHILDVCHVLETWKIFIINLEWVVTEYVLICLKIWMAGELSFPLCMIFISSTCECVLSREGSSSLVVPIYLEYFRYDPLNFRPVSLTSLPCKLLGPRAALLLCWTFDCWRIDLNI